MFTEDRSVFFDTNDFAVSASWTPSGGGSAQTANVILDKPDEELVGGDVKSTDYQMMYDAADFDGLVKGETVTVDGVSYTVRDNPMAEDDGNIMRAPLRKVKS